MSQLEPRESRHGLDHHGIVHTARIHWNYTTAQLYEEAVQRGEGVVAHGGPLVVETGQHTGRSPKDKYILQEPNTDSQVDWGKVNVPISEEGFERLYGKALAYLQHREVFVQDLLTGADPRYQKKVRFINELAWHNLFVRSLFLRPTADQLPEMKPDITVIHVPGLHADPSTDGTRSGTFVICDFHKNLVIIGGTGYAGEQKKSIFTAMNYLLPLQGVFPMHCSANYGQNGDAALFFGLSGTGKTTLSADPERTLIGDDEHGWSDDGVFNFEGGCYAKVINLSQEAEPQIWEATHSFGTVLENVVVDPLDRELDLDDDSKTENTRAAYPLINIPGCDLSGTCDHPKNVIFLTCDAYGVMPPIAKLTRDQAKYHFLAGYTARVAGTEKGVTEPEATFSACFGAPFMVHKPAVYADLLGEKIDRHGSTVWLINTGWTGGPAGVGSRMKISHTRRIVKAALSGELDAAEFRTNAIFGVEVPQQIEGVPTEVLTPRDTWADKGAFDQQAKKLAKMFQDNFQAFAADVSEGVRNAGPNPDAA